MQLMNFVRIKSNYQSFHKKNPHGIIYSCFGLQIPLPGIIWILPLGSPVLNTDDSQYQQNAPSVSYERTFPRVDFKCLVILFL